jgi:hypothetical protein
MHRWDIINTLIQRNNYKSYLEIGYFKGWSFDNIDCKEKIAVDPNPSKSEWQLAMEYGKCDYDRDTDWKGEIINNTKATIFKLRSDEFFHSLHSNREWDIIFIDGLHEASQVTKDIENSLKHLSPGGTIVMHDCKPEIYEHTTTGDCGGNWLGDTYKAFLKFRFENPEYNAYVVDTDWGCGIIETPPDSENTYINGLYKGEDYRKFLPYEEFEKDKAGLLNLISVEEFKTKMNERITDNNLSAK